MAGTNTPHDNFCKAALSDIRVAKSVLLKYLAPEIVAIINFDTLCIYP